MHCSHKAKPIVLTTSQCHCLLSPRVLYTTFKSPQNITRKCNPLASNSSTEVSKARNFKSVSTHVLICVLVHHALQKGKDFTFKLWCARENTWNEICPLWKDERIRQFKILPRGKTVQLIKPSSPLGHKIPILPSSICLLQLNLTSAKTSPTSFCLILKA